MESDFRERIILNNFEIADARELFRAVREELPDVQVTTGEEHGATPPEWIELILRVGTWVHAVGPAALKCLGQGALTFIGGQAAKATLTTLRKRRAAAPEGPSVVKAIEASPAKRAVLRLALPNGQSVTFLTKRTADWRVAEQLCLMAALADAIEAGRVALPAEAQDYRLLSDRRGTRLSFVQASGRRKSIPLIVTAGRVEVAPSRGDRSKERQS